MAPVLKFFQVSIRSNFSKFQQRYTHKEKERERERERDKLSTNGGIHKGTREPRSRDGSAKFRIRERISLRDERDLGPLIT